MSTFKHQRIHIMGAPGAGISTLGRALAEALEAPYFDVDDFYWFTSDPLPFKRKRNPDHRRALLQQSLDESASWVLGGSLCGWGDVFIPRFDLTVYARLETSQRLERIRQRELKRYGPAMIAPGGELHRVFEKFLDWAAGYDTVETGLRSAAFEKKWLTALPCRVIELNMEAPTDLLVQQLLPAMQV